MITVDNLKVKLKGYGIMCYEVKSKDVFPTLRMANNDIDSFIDFVMNNRIKNTFYLLRYYTKGSFYIEDEDVDSYSFRKASENITFSDFDKIPRIKEAICQHNEILESIDFSRPAGMEVFCIYEGKCIAVNLYDEWYLEFGILPKQEKLAEINNKYFDDLEKLYEEKLLKEERELYEQKLKEERTQMERERLLEEFKEFVLRDSDFRSSTFPGARRDYARMVFTTRKDTAKYKQLFYEEDDIDCRDNRKAYYFIESIWREYSSQK